MKKKGLLLFLTALTIALGFFRDFVFVPINKIIESGNDPDGKLALTKWGLTLLFTLAYLAITCGFLYVLFKAVKYVLASMVLYGVLLFVSAITVLIGYIFFSFHDVYPFVRTLMGVAQSPVILMILIPACLLNEGYPASKKK